LSLSAVVLHAQATSPSLTLQPALRRRRTHSCCGRAPSTRAYMRAGTTTSTSALQLHRLLHSCSGRAPQSAQPPLAPLASDQRRPAVPTTSSYGRHSPWYGWTTDDSRGRRGRIGCHVQVEHLAGGTSPWQPLIREGHEGGGSHMGKEQSGSAGPLYKQPLGWLCERRREENQFSRH
jgi:hypothetical protein